MVNLSYPELAEISNANLPPASLDALKTLRNRMCETSSSGFKLQSQQRFLRRVLSPESPVRNLLMVHGTGTGKTCTAIQVAEEYILRPEFQDKKVLVIASRAVEENFRTELFDIDRTNIDVIAGTIESKQCTGRRYLDMLLRIESEPKNWNNPDIRDKLESTANKIINEFYEFTAYNSFGLQVNKRQVELSKLEYDTWVHENFDNRLMIIDEAHNVRSDEFSTESKEVSSALESIVKTANGLVLVLLTATPMYNTFEEIVFYMNLFYWNDRKQDLKQTIKVAEFFNGDGTLKPGEPTQKFRQWCQEYVSFVRGENPFTFPFRLPPPKVIAQQEVSKSFLGKSIGDNERMKYLSLVESKTQGIQQETLTKTDRTDNDEKRQALLEPTISVLPGRKSFREAFSSVGKQYAYINEPFLTPEQLPNHSAKFVSVIRSIEDSKGVAFVYSNLATMGARLFAMALEEHGFTPAMGNTLLANPSYTGASKGKYILLTSKASDSEISDMLAMVKSQKNRDGSQVRVIISSPIVSEGVDFRYVRQIHILDPWWNMSRIEQVIGRGLRTCSHKLLPFEEQNCTVYLHVVRTGDGIECFDEYTYRSKVEQKAIKIAQVRKVLAESAMDCPLQNSINTLPEDWKNLEVPQLRAENREAVSFRLRGMMGPAFDDTPEVSQCIVTPSKEDPEHVRPLSTYLDVRDELLEKVGRLMIDKPIWDREELLSALRPFTQEVAIYNLQQAISSGFRFKDSFGRPALLDSRGDLYALSPIGIPNGTLIERTTQPQTKGSRPLPDVVVKEEIVEMSDDVLQTKRDALVLPIDAKERFSEEVLNGYVFDHEFTDAEKRAYLKTNPENIPFIKSLVVSEDLIVLGKDTFEPPGEPIGSIGTQYTEWKKALVQKFIEKKAIMFASVKNKKFTLSKMNIKEDGTIERKIEKAAKRYEPIACGTGDNDIKSMLAYMKFVDTKGIGAPPKKIPSKKKEGAIDSDKKLLESTTDFSNAGEMCVYAELLTREQAAENEEKVFWITPEELAVLYDGKGTKGNPTNQDTFTQAFKK